MAQKRSWFGRVWRWLLGAVLASLLVSALAVLSLRWIDPPISSFMLQAWVGSLFDDSKGFKLDHRWVDLNRISPNLALAVVASEDQKFPEHWGFDVEAIEKAYQMNRHYIISAARAPSRSRCRRICSCGRDAVIFERGWKAISPSSQRASCRSGGSWKSM